MRKKLQRSDYERLIEEYEAKGKAEGQASFARRSAWHQRIDATALALPAAR